MTLHVVGTFFTICAIPWAIGLGMLGIGRWLDVSAPDTLALTDDRGRSRSPRRT